MGHRCLCATDLAAAEIELVGAAEQFGVVANSRGTAPEGDRQSVEPENTPQGIAGVSGDGKQIDEFGRRVEQLA
jgi:hypothetical protein